MDNPKKQGRDRRTLSKQPWELKHVASKFQGCKLADVRKARKAVMLRAGLNRTLVEAELRKSFKKV